VRCGKSFILGNRLGKMDVITDDDDDDDGMMMYNM
jgi:hypothetical protein